MNTKNIIFVLFLMLILLPAQKIFSQALDVMNANNDTLLHVQEDGKVGIGDTSPTHTLEVAGKIGINDTTVLFMPDQTLFAGSLFLGNGGRNISHPAGGFNGWANTGVGLGALHANTTGYWNTASGMGALGQNTAGWNNTAFGAGALFQNKANRNTAVGMNALYANTIGYLNTALGSYTLFNNTTGISNTGIGYEANRYNQTGSNNTIIGYQAGMGSAAHNKSGNVFLGYQAGLNETGSNKLYIENSNSTTPLIGGDFAADELYLNGKVGIGTGTSPVSQLEVAGTVHSTSGGFKFPDGTVQTTAATGGGGSLWNQAGSDIYYNSGNVGIGDTSPTHTLDVAGKIGINDTTVLYLPDQTDFEGSLFLGNGGGSLRNAVWTTQGHFNTAVGINALNFNTIGSSNTAIGYRALFQNTEGHYNVASGHKALYSNTTGELNTAIGMMALSKNSTGNKNTASGGLALQWNTSGERNTATGFNALASNSTGDSNTAIGYSALAGNSTGVYNTATGDMALQSNTYGVGNTACGYKALYSNKTGGTNTACGSQALYSNTTGINNVCIGFRSNYGNQAGSKNTIIGFKAGRTGLNSQSGNVFIGYFAGAMETGDNKLCIDTYDGWGNPPLIWGDFANDRLVINGNSTNNFNNRTFFSNGAAGGTTAWFNDSDRRLKKNIKTIPSALEKVKKLRGVNYEWQETEHRLQGLQMGFIAQEAKDVIPEVVDSDGEFYSMQYAPITALLVEAVKEQDVKIKALEAENEKLKRAFARNEQLAKKVLRLEQVVNKILKNRNEGEMKMAGIESGNTGTGKKTTEKGFSRK